MKLINMKSPSRIRMTPFPNSKHSTFEPYEIIINGQVKWFIGLPFNEDPKSHEYVELCSPFCHGCPQQTLRGLSHLRISHWRTNFVTLHIYLQYLTNQWQWQKTMNAMEQRDGISLLTSHANNHQMIGVCVLEVVHVAHIVSNVI